ncbi:MAG: hypothetical protein GX649_13410 [Chloroflexi bacterium]|nr:hypothetical protein [Chloroflexota bacterium]
MATERTPWGQRALYVLAWPVTAALSLVVLVLWREAILDVLTLAGAHSGRWDRQTLDAVDRVMILAMAMVGVGAFIGLEYYMRRGLAKGRFVQRLILVVGAEVGLALAALAIQALV